MDFNQKQTNPFMAPAGRPGQGLLGGLDASKPVGTGAGAMGGVQPQAPWGATGAQPQPFPAPQALGTDARGQAPGNPLSPAGSGSDLPTAQLGVPGDLSPPGGEGFAAINPGPPQLATPDPMTTGAGPLTHTAQPPVTGGGFAGPGDAFSPAPSTPAQPTNWAPMTPGAPPAQPGAAGLLGGLAGQPAPGNPAAPAPGAAGAAPGAPGGLAQLLMSQGRPA